MSKFRVEVDIAFNAKEDATDLLNVIETIKQKTFKGTGEEEISIIQRCEYHECFHDEIPPKPCGNSMNVDFDLVAKIHTVDSLI